MSRVLGVTGASGYIGQSLSAIARSRGWQLVAIGRRPIPGWDAFRYADLALAPPQEIFDGLNAVVHLAANTTGTALPPEAEHEFARVLAERCHERGIGLVVVSSQAASTDAPSRYGRTKAAIEQAVDNLGAIVVRPGQVIGGSEQGLFGTLVRLVKALPVLPMLLPRPSVQPIHVDDLSLGLLIALETPGLAGSTLAMAGETIRFDELLMKIAHHRLRIRRLRLPVPSSLLRATLGIVGRMLGPGLSSERLDSLTQLPPMAATEDLRRLGVVLRPLSVALDRRSRLRRVLLHEALMLSRAFTGRRASMGLARRYVRLLPQLGIQFPLDLPAAVMMSPLALASLDSSSFRTDAFMDFHRRMDVVVRLSESEPANASLFIMRNPRAGVLRACMAFMYAVLTEGQVRVAALWLRCSLRNRR